jgi:hypothetical protein
MAVRIGAVDRVWLRPSEHEPNAIQSPRDVPGAERGRDNRELSMSIHGVTRFSSVQRRHRLVDRTIVPFWQSRTLPMPLTPKVTCPPV